MFSYIAYGLGIRSAFPLPEFVRSDAPTDVTICLDGDEVPTETLPDQPHFEITPEETVLAFKHVGIFRVRRGREIVVTPASGGDLSMIRLFLVGKVLGTVLYQRGMLVLHGSSVEVDGRAVVFIGTSCIGKSSIAAALYCAGHSIVADDVTALDQTSGRPRAIPAFPLLKIDPAVAESLGHSADSLVLLHPRESRRGLPVADRFATSPVPLGLVYLLEPDSACRERGPQEVLIELIRESFPTRLLHSGGAMHLRQCASLARTVPMMRLSIADARVPPAELSRRVRHDLSTVN